MTTSERLEDRLQIERLINLYGHVIDNREWPRLAEIFSADVVFDSTDMGSRLRTSLAQLREDWEKPDTPHPLAHHATNIVIDFLSQDEARVLSKGLGLREENRVGSVTYEDLARRTAEGWRIVRRRATRRRARAQANAAA